MQTERDPRINAIPDIHGHAKGEHKPYTEERPLPLTARMLFLWFYHACRRGSPRFLMVADHMNYLTFEDPAAVNLVRRALKLAQAGDLYGAAETANVDVAHAQIVSEGLRRGMRYSIGAEVDNDPRARPDAQNIVDAMRPDGLIRSIHFLPIEHPVHGPNWNWPFDNPEFSSLYDHVGTEKTWEIYMTVLLDAIERLSGNIIGHFYVPAKFGHWPDESTLEKYEDQFLDAVAARGMAVEFNTRFLYGDHTDEEKARYLDANRRLLRKAQAKGVGIAIGSDAHSPRDQGNGFATVLAVLDELEINEIVFPIAGRLARVALRFVKPPEPIAPPPPPPPPEPVVVRAPRPAPQAEAEPEVVEPLAKPARKRPAKTATVAAETPPEAAAEPEPIFAAAVAPEEPAPAEVAAPKPKKAAKAKPAAEPVVVTAADPEPEPQPAPEPEAPAPKPAKKPVVKAAPAPVPAVKIIPKPEPAKPVILKAAPVKTAAAAAKAKPAPKIAPKAAAKAKPAPAKPPAKAPPKATPKAAVKAAPAKKAPSKAPVKPVAKKGPAKKAPAPAKKAPAKKAPAKAAPAKKAVAVKKPVAKKPPAKPVAKNAPAKKAPAKKPVAKKAPAKKTAAKRR